MASAKNLGSARPFHRLPPGSAAVTTTSLIQTRSLSTNMDRLYSAEQLVVPPELPPIIKAYTKEIIRYQPKDIVAFSRDYFAALASGGMSDH